MCAKQIKKSEFAGKGAFVQLIGVILCFLFFPFGIVAGLVLLIAGSSMSTVRKCSDCMDKVEKEAKVCPHCRTRFE